MPLDKRDAAKAASRKLNTPQTVVVAVVLLLPVTLAVVVYSRTMATTQHPSPAAYALGRAFGSTICWLFAAALIAAIVHRLTSRISNWICVGLFAGLVLLFSLGALVGTGAVARRADINRLYTEMDQAGDRMQQQIAAADSAGQHVDIQAASAEFLEKLGQIADRSAGDEGRVIHILGEFLADFLASGANYRQTLRPFLESGGVNSVRTPQDVADRRRDLSAARAEFAKLKAMYTEGEQILLDRLKQSGIPEARWRSLFTGFASRFKDPAARQVQEIEGELLKQIDGHLATLQKFDGDWTNNSGRLEFERGVPEAAIKSINQRLELIDLLVKQQERMHDQALSKARAGGRR